MKHFCKHIVLLAFLNSLIFHVNADEPCGDNVIAKYRATDSTLILSGSGSTYNYSGGMNPWFESVRFIRHIIIEEGITHIGNQLFNGLTQVIDISLPEGLIGIGDMVFSRCQSITEIHLPSTLKSIGEYTFNECVNLIQITIPASVETIGEGLFAGCTSVRSIKVEADNKFYDSRDACEAIIETSSNYLLTGCLNTIIPSSVIGIKRGAFQSMKIESPFILPNSIKVIGEYAFFGCSRLTSITIPYSVTEIGGAAFCQCVNLDTVRIERTIPPTVVSPNTFCGSNKNLIVPIGCREIYSNMPIWKSFTNIIEGDYEGAISNIDTSTKRDAQGGKIYNVIGREATNKSEPLMPGLYIIRGEKVLIK